MAKRYVEEGNEIYVYNDESLDPYIKLLNIIENSEDWLFLEALGNYHDSFIFFDCNELSYKLYKYVNNKAISYEIRDKKWEKIYGIKETERVFHNMHSPILISDEVRNIGDGKERRYSNACYAFLRTIFKVNIFLLSEKNLDKQLFLQRLNAKGMFVHSLPIDQSYAGYLDLVRVMGDDTKIPELLKQIKLATSKKIVGVLCNCQGEILVDMLRKQTKFLDEYFIMLLPPLWYIKKKSIGGICKDIFGWFDLFIYQFVKTSFYQPFFATDNIIQFLRRDCWKICIPDLYFDGYYPQTNYHINQPTDMLLTFADGSTFFQVRDYFIEEVYSLTGSISLTIDTLLSIQENGFKHFNKSEIENYWNDAICRMIENEKKSDLKMSDYILENVKKKCIFTAAHNPVNEVLYVEAKKLLEMLSLPFDEFDYNNMQNFGGAQQIIYPYVKKILKLDFDIQEIYINTAFTNKLFNIKEYIELYIRNICEIDLCKKKGVYDCEHNEIEEINGI